MCIKSFEAANVHLPKPGGAPTGGPGPGG